MSVALALEAREYAIDDWITEEGVRRAAQLWVTMGADSEMGDHEKMHNAWQIAAEKGLDSPEGIEFKENVRSVLHTMIGFLKDARVYVIDEHVSQGIVEGTRTLPPHTPLAASLLACPVGFAYLEGNHLHVAHPHRPNGDIVRAINWSAGPANARGVPTLVFGIWVDRGEGHVRWRQVVLSPEGNAWDGPIMQAKFDDNGHAGVNMIEAATPASEAIPEAQRVTMRQVVAYMLILGAFVSERIVVADEQQPDRYARKRAARLGRQLGTAHVIHMREYEHTVGRRNGLGGPEWSCSWIVSAHVRKQYHPSTGEHVLTWIRSYVKGDRAKPLKVSRPVVRVVDR